MPPTNVPPWNPTLPDKPLVHTGVPDTVSYFTLKPDAVESFVATIYRSLPLMVTAVPRWSPGPPKKFDGGMRVGACAEAM